MKITQMTSPRTGKAVPNQFIIESKDGDTVTEVFQSYDSVIVKIERYDDGSMGVYLDTVYWNYSKTTSKYRSQFLGESTKETQAKIDSGEYVLTNLN